MLQASRLTYSSRSARHQVKSMTHPMVGPIEMHCNLLVVPDRDQLMVLFTADPGSPSQQALSLLSVIGTQDMTPENGGPGASPLHSAGR
ncbi:MmyB family transcriptional regulator [Mycolicibacterium hippocampi]|nr:hypothetical protein [Mycolicibacterium hippocampi]